MGSPQLTELRVKAKDHSVPQGQAVLRNEAPPPCLAATSPSQQVSPALALWLLSSGSRWQKGPRGQDYSKLCLTGTIVPGRLRDET